MRMTEQEFIIKYDKNGHFSQDELRHAVRNFYKDNQLYDIEEEVGCIRRPICRIRTRTFCIPWKREILGCPRDGFYYQPYEVQKKQYEKTITVTEWIPIKEEVEI